MIEFRRNLASHRIALIGSGGAMFGLGTLGDIFKETVRDADFSIILIEKGDR